jgi:phosphohistidine phosphatase
MDLTFLRHGKAITQASTDDERGLTEEGMAEVRSMALQLKKAGEMYDHIFSSPLRRAKETAEIFGEIFGKQGQTDSRLSCGCKIEMIRDLTDEQQETQRLLLVGHAPDFELITAQLLGLPSSLDFRKGSALKLTVSLVAPGTGHLIFFVSPELFHP